MPVGFRNGFLVNQLPQNNFEKTRKTLKWFPMPLMLKMSLIPLLEWILDSNWSQKVVQFQVFSSKGKITIFGNLQLISSTEVGGVEDWGENVKLFSTVDCFKHLSTRAITWKEISSLLRIFSYSTSYSFGSKRFRSSSSINFTFLILSSWLYFNPDKRSTKLTSRLSMFYVMFFNSFSTFSRLLKSTFLFPLTTVICSPIFN